MHKVHLNEKPEHFLKKLDKNERERIIKKLTLLETNPQLGKPLTGPLAGLWSLRIGDYRVIYQIKDKELIILVLKIGHRKNVYK